MKVAELNRCSILMGFALTYLRKKKHQHLYGSGIAPAQPTRYRSGALKLCKALLKCAPAHCTLGQTLKADTGRRWWVRAIFEDHDICGAWFNLIPTLRAVDPEGFYNFFRMNIETFDSLLTLVTPYVTKRSFRVPICPGERLAITLRYIATGNSFVDLSYLFRVSSQCISNIVNEMTVVIWSVLENSVFEKFSTDFWLQQAAMFESMWNLPHCLGAIDGKFVDFRALPHSGSQFFNYKKAHSMILMAISDAKYRFIMADFGAAGRRGDTNVFRFCTFGKKLRHGLLNIPPPLPQSGFKDDLPFFFAGDAAFSSFGYVLTPFKGDFLPDEEAVFNYRISRARRVIENAFGILVARFIILQNRINGSKSLIKSVLLCCVALHNLHLRNEASIPPKRKRYCPEGFADSEVDGIVTLGRWRNENKQEQTSLFSSLKEKLALDVGAKLPKWDVEQVTENFVEYFVDHPLPWQWRCANVASEF